MKNALLPLFFASIAFASTPTSDEGQKVKGAEFTSENTLQAYVRGSDSRGRPAWLQITVTPLGITPDQITSPMHMAAEANDIETIKVLLESGFDVDALNEKGRSALMIACIKGHYELAELLLEHGANKELLDNQGNNILIILSCFNDAEGVRFLLSKGFDTELVDKAGFTPLLRACNAGAGDAAKLLLDAGADIQARNKYNQSALVLSARGGLLDLVKYFIEQGISEHELDGFGFNAFAQACVATRVEVMKFFLARGANPSACTEGEYKSTMLILSITKNRENSVEAVQTLLDAGADIEGVNIYDESALRYACARNMLPVINLLIDRGACINDEQKKENAIHTAINWYSLAAVELLLERGLDVNCRDADDVTPLQLAAWYGALDIATLLLEKGADLESRTLQGFTPLINAADGGNKDLLQLFLLRGAELNALTKRERSALDYAVKNGDYESCEMLIERGADLNGFNEAGFSPLHVACSLGRYDIVRLLVKHGAIINLKDITGRTAIDYAKERHLRETVILLDYEGKIQAGKLAKRVSITDSEKPSFTKALFYACSLGNTSRIDQLLSSGLSIDTQREEDAQTALIHCCYAGYEDIATMLVNRGGKLELQDKAGNTALLAAASSGNHDLVQALIAKGAKTDTLNAQGQGLLHLASRGGDIELMTELIEQGAAIDSRDALGQTPLFLACEGYDIAALQFLIEKGADIDAQRKDDKTALMLACHYGYSAPVYALLDAGADPTLVDEQGQDALICSQLNWWVIPKKFDICAGPYKSRVEVCTMLLDFGANPQLQDKAGETAIHYSRVFKYSDCESLISHFAQGGTLDSLLNQEQRDRSLYEAIGKERWEMVQLYLNHGADVNAKIRSGYDCPLAAAIRQGNLELFKQLLDLGANPQFRYPDNRTLLFVAARGLQLEMIRILHAQGVDINAQSKDFGNALHAAYACTQDKQGKDIPSEKRLECLQLLLHLGADPNQAAEGGQSFFESLKEQNQELLIQQLSQ